MKKSLLLIAVLYAFVPLFSQSNPKRELRGAWIATVSRIDWPSTNNTEVQKNDLINILDELDEAGINAVFFQVRPECDALYYSEIEPWSYWLTGSQGSAPNPYYDPLEFVTEEAHKRGMEIHAWCNPYRVKVSTSSYTFSPDHVINQHPDWILYVGDDTVLDPGLPEVREYVSHVFSDIARRYDVDGLHIDDYFYPWAGISNEDQLTFQTYPRGFNNISNWRRDNVNLLIEMIQDSLVAIDENIKWGVSPFGIWKSGTPPGIIGTSAWGHPLYCDAVTWLNQEWIDYLAPQLYWEFGGPQDYGLLAPWWASVMNGRHLYPGQAVYRIQQHNWPSTEIINQILLNRDTEEIKGSIFFSTQSILGNFKGITDSLKNNYYKTKALVPAMEFKDNIIPNSPANFVYERAPGKGIAALQWDTPAPAADGDTSRFYVVYRSDQYFVDPSDIDDPQKILDVINEKGFNPPVPEQGPSSYYYVATTLDRNYNESEMSSVATVNLPGVPQLAYPEDNAQNQRDTTMIGWYFPEQAGRYRVQIAQDQAFTNIVLEDNEVYDTTYAVTGIAGQENYYWRVESSNAAGTGSFSDAREFSTGFPLNPAPIYPPQETTDIELDPLFKWSSVPGAHGYRLQIAESLSILPETIIFDSLGFTDTTWLSFQLNPLAFYSWRVTAYNEYGQSIWSDIYKFMTVNQTGVEVVDEDIPKEYALSQNYPNPFNPSTRINFAIPKAGHVSLKVYDLLGREVAVLADEELRPGNYTVELNGSRLSSGVYFYVLRAANKVKTNKMILLK